MKTQALYGFSPTLPPIMGRSPAEQVAWLRGLGCTAIFGGYQDPAFVAAAHAAGMMVYAEFGCFVGQTWWEQCLASRPITATGGPLEPEGWYYGVNPTVPEVRAAQLAALERLLLAYPLDGVWLDFIRWPCHWEVGAPYLPHTAFDPRTLTLFRRATGIAIPTADPTAAGRLLFGAHAPAWTAWRCAQITEWVAAAQAVVRRVRPGALLGLFGVPWRLTDHDGAILNVIGQDYRSLGQYVDVISPMVYHRMCGQPVGWIAAVTAEVQRLSGKPVWPIIQAVNEPASLPAAEYGAALDAALDCPAASGVVVFTLEGAIAGAKLAVTRAKLGCSLA
jgi:hypothetical protein